MSEPRDKVPIFVYRGTVVVLLAVVGYFLSQLHAQQQRDHDLLIKLETTQSIHLGELSHLREQIDKLGRAGQ